VRNTTDQELEPEYERTFSAEDAKFYKGYVPEAKAKPRRKKARLGKKVRTKATAKKGS
jgi:hypothetical protein